MLLYQMNVFFEVLAIPNYFFIGLNKDVKNSLVLWICC